ncbi:type VI secretion system-associated protein TagF [Pantoea sp. 1.19]|uniref:type VI secretion system-associated protein TagF n=1 Tax=Pantoea sp. 1.19 TaxID=1925589 RepID=UPI000948DC42|nr:type VI secretion system-associated protein TagF [Pantoea sp. 1.19]
MAERYGLGWYGKLPGAGDFLQRRVSDATVSAWSNWFQSGLSHWHQFSGLAGDRFGLAPIWNFALPATLGIQRVQIGCLLPSRDRVGRAWPLLALRSFAPAHWHPAQLALAGEWFDDLGETLGAAVRNRLDAEQLDAQLMALPPLTVPDPRPSAILEVLGWQSLPGSLRWDEVGSHFDPMQYVSYWWTNQRDGYPLTTHKHSGKLTAQLFTTLFHPAAGSRPGQHGLYPPMFD